MSELHPVTPLAGSQARQHEQSEEYRGRGVHQEQPKKDLLTENEIVDDIVSRVDEEVPNDVKKKLRDVWNRHPTVFSKGEYDLGWTNLVT